MNDNSGDRTVAATVSQVGLEDAASGPMMIGESGADLSGIDLATAAVHALDADKENNWGQRRGCELRSVNLQGKPNHAACHRPRPLNETRPSNATTT